ncbi:hypothetical protein N1030_16935 [Desulfovibrio mangrovi]|uniref:hypothetical protein n=1 Tax=Desulfovibrio mangrovi TaxID=2976983 RepID=UPI0022478DC5|nr:hypothetical protein [Desulfovibrio mangrovi]UZP67257.1 hypothetical protein N1030_16935 [Desulfovibrio mangrovi]
MRKNGMDDMIEKLGEDFAKFAGTLRDVERTEDGDFIVPADVMLSIVGHVESMFGTVRKTHVSVKSALVTEQLSRDRAWDLLMEEADCGTEH